MRGKQGAARGSVPVMGDEYDNATVKGGVV